MRVGDYLELLACGAARMKSLAVEERSHCGERGFEFAILNTLDCAAPACWAIQTDDAAHCGGFPRAVGAEEAGYASGSQAEAEVVDGGG